MTYRSSTAPDYVDVSGAPFASSSNKCILLGDSLLAQYTAITSAGGSTIDPNHISQTSFVGWFQALAGFPWQITSVNRGGFSSDYTAGGQNKGFSGDETFDVLARFKHQVLNQSPAFVVVNVGTNDITAGRTYDTIMANIKDIVELCLDAGAVVWMNTIFPRHNREGNDFDAAEEIVRDALNTEIKRFSNYYGGRVVVIDCDPILTDPATDKMYLTYAYDGVHLSSTGAKALGTAYLAKWQQTVGTSRMPRYIPEAYNASTVPYGDLFTNSALSGTAGTLNTGFSGSLADSWTATRTDGSSATSVISMASRETIDGGTATFAQCLATSTGAGVDNETHRIAPTATITTGAIVGQAYVLEVECHVDAVASGVNNLRSVYAELRDSGTNGPITRMFNVGFTAGSIDDYVPEGSMKLLFRSQPVIANTTTGLIVRLNWDIDARLTGTRTVAWGQPVLRIVPNAMEEELVVSRVQKYNVKGANFVAHLPPGALIESITFDNTTANAVTGGVRIGTTAAGTDVVTAQAIGASAKGAITDAALLKKFFSRTATTPLYIEAVTSWNSAAVNFNIVYKELI